LIIIIYELLPKSIFSIRKLSKDSFALWENWGHSIFQKLETNTILLLRTLIPLLINQSRLSKITGTMTS